MSRAALQFQASFDNACEACGYTPAQIAASADAQRNFLRRWNEAFQVAVDLPAQGWEDLRTSAEIEPVDGLTIDFSVFGDSTTYEIWTQDPRPQDNAATRVAFNTTLEGLTLSSEHDTVYAFWMPSALTFTLTAWATTTTYAVGVVVLSGGDCYRCLSAHESSVFATDLGTSKWVKLIIPGIFRSFLPRFLQGSFLIETGQAETGFRMQAKARQDLEEMHVRALTHSTR